MIPAQMPAMPKVLMMPAASAKLNRWQKAMPQPLAPRVRVTPTALHPARKIIRPKKVLIQPVSRPQTSQRIVKQPITNRPARVIKPPKLARATKVMLIQARQAELEAGQQVQDQLLLPSKTLLLAERVLAINPKEILTVTARL